MINIPQVIENKADFFRINEVTRFTVNTTTSGFTLAYQPMALASPAKRVTYFGIVAYNWCCTIQNPVIIKISTINRPLEHTFTKPVHICRKVFPSPACLSLL